MKITNLAAGLVLVATAATAAVAAAAATPAIADLGGDHRVLIVSAPSGSGDLAAQRVTLGAWQQGAQERDVAPVILDGPNVDGASDTAAVIRARYAIPSDGLAVVLVGKDGHVAYRASQPVTASDLEQVIDAMPMRRAGQR